jgi:hypothetical protein
MSKYLMECQYRKLKSLINIYIVLVRIYGIKILVDWMYFRRKECSNFIWIQMGALEDSILLSSYKSTLLKNKKNTKLLSNKKGRNLFFLNIMHFN